MFGLGPANNDYTDPAPAQEAAALPYLIPYMAPEVVEVAGDFNQDDVASGDDLLLWNMSFGRSGLDLAADGDDDGDVDGSDFLSWQQTLGMATAATAVSSQVPEPASAALVVAATLAVFAVRRRNARR